MIPEKEIREAIAALDRVVNQRKRLTNTQLAAMFAANETLRWVLGERDHLYADLMASVGWSWARQDDGSYVSGTGYRVERYAPRHWVASRPDGSPITGLGVFSSRGLAQTACQRDSEHRI